MITINLTYNPFTKEKFFYVNGKEERFYECWKNDEKELSDWSVSFFNCLSQKYKDSQITVHFKGICRDYEFLQDAKNIFESENPSSSISLIDAGCIDVGDKLSGLKKIIRKNARGNSF